MVYDNKAEMLRLKKELAELRKVRARLKRHAIHPAGVGRKVRENQKKIEKIKEKLCKLGQERRVSEGKGISFKDSSPIHKRAGICSKAPNLSLSEIGEIAPKKKKEKEDKKN